SLGAAQFCINEAVAYANERVTWGRPLSRNQAIQFPLVELHTEAAMLRQLIRSTAWSLDRHHHMEVTHLVAMCNYRANRLVCEAADQIGRARLNSSHLVISYAVFCLKKKKRSSISDTIRNILCSSANLRRAIQLILRLLMN